MKAICAIVASLVLAGTAFAETINVPADYPTIQQALESAHDGDVIELSEGEYFENVSIYNMPDVTIRGVGGSEKTIWQGIGQRGLDFAFPYKTNDNTLIIEGITFQNCLGSPDSGGNPGGGAIFGRLQNYTDGEVQISNCVFRSNSATDQLDSSGDEASVVLIRTGNFIITNCEFYNNETTCIGVQGNGQGLVSNTTFTNNSGSYVINYLKSITNCDFISNSVTSVTNLNVETITDCLFELNICQQYGVQAESITNCIFTNNVSEDSGGAIGVEFGTIVSSCSFNGNAASSNGGAIAVFNSAPLSAYNCNFTSNSATNIGGAIWANESAFVLVANPQGCDNTPTTFYGVDKLINDQTIEVCDANTNCCVGGSCVSTDEQSCLDAGGTYITEECSSCPGPSPDLGACCINGACIPSTAEGCFDGGGAYAGDGAECESAGCPETCPGDLTGDNEVTIIDLLFVIEQWGVTCP